MVRAARATSPASPTSTSTPATTTATPTSTSSSRTSGASSASWACWSACRRRRTATSRATTSCARWASTGSRSASRSSTATLFGEICPGKHREYGLDFYLEAIRYCARARRARAAARAVGHQRRDHRRPRAAGVVDPRDRLDHVGRRDPDRLRLPAAQSAPTTATLPPPEDRGARSGLRAALRSVHGARPADRLRARTSTSAWCCCPRSARSAVARRFPVQRMKLAAMSTAFGYQFRRRTELAERGAALAHAS